MLIKTFTSIALFISLVLIVSPLFAADSLNGELAHQKECLRCHATSVYNGQKSNLNNLDQLDAKIYFCAEDNQLDWSNKESKSVLKYVNDNFYRF